MRSQLQRRLVLLGAVALAGCLVMSVAAWAAGNKELSLSEVARRLLGLEGRVAKIDQRLSALEEQLRKPSGTAVAKKPIIEITSPRGNAEVGRDVIVEGIVRVDDLAGRYPVVGVHPMLADLIYIQPLPMRLEKVQDGYRFRTRVYCGTKDKGIGEKFELSALLAKKGQLKEGDELAGVPKGVPVSPSVLVTRARN